jgi:hypothetical protein
LVMMTIDNIDFGFIAFIGFVEFIRLIRSTMLHP